MCEFGDLKISELWLRLQEHTNECKMPQCILVSVYPCIPVIGRCVRQVQAQIVSANVQ